VQGGLYTYEFSTGEISSYRGWTPLPMPNEVIDRVHPLTEAEKVSQGKIYGEGEDISNPARSHHKSQEWRLIMQEWMIKKMRNMCKI